MIPKKFLCPKCGTEVDTSKADNYDAHRIGRPTEPGSIYLFLKFCPKCRYTTSFRINEELFGTYRKIRDLQEMLKPALIFMKEISTKHIEFALDGVEITLKRE